MTLPALEITGLQASENRTPILHGVDLHVATGEAVALLGRHGAELTATLRAVLGDNPARSGSIRIHGVESIGLDAYAVSHLGVAACPARPDIVSGLTCEENLLLPLPLEGVLGGGLSLTEIYELFPSLRRCRSAPGVNLDESQQQMLALARVLRSGANLLLFDQICAGLPGPAARTMGQTITALKSLGYSILFTERNPDFPTDVADRGYLLEDGVAQEQDTADSAASLLASASDSPRILDASRLTSSQGVSAHIAASLTPPALASAVMEAAGGVLDTPDTADGTGVPMLTPAYAQAPALTDDYTDPLP
ncbi:ATP-binding cassette domain-containing protein [Achromobacter aloeverae]|uniref:ABC transporter ATP-binding protein n=1 Tax=Achromobacter aloeverae TaxID=1750518 RepID=A0A4Q1HN37_9BURK|nr:ATP-binding cassette domain-containing protein [Achromobacter aloeverae]RXN92414.1 ABC transporter ATP-binding protein [Achromobacter aloeverae]